jgi:polar amino acid transport system substrate-binding protein
LKQVIQTMRDGHVRLEDVPAPQLAERFVLVETLASVISAGTEKTKIDMGKRSLLEKARSRPDLVKRVLQKIRSDGFAATLQTVSARLDSAAPLGYSSAGRVLAVGREVRGVRPGDLVACAGAGYANHAEVVSVPRNLVAKVPDCVAAEEAAFATLGAIALQGVRLVEPRLGETVLVIGLGLLGQLALQLLAVNGCKVIGTDIDEALCARAAGRGVVTARPGRTLVEVCDSATRGHGVDAVLICAGTTSNEPIELAGDVVRERGRVVIVGAVGMSVPREPFFRKEASIVVSRSYGPGRYDPGYEELGNDYPYGYVRFTEQRNMETFLELLASGRMDVRSLITHRFSFEEAVDAYALIEGEKREPYLGIVLEYASANGAPGPSTMPVPGPSAATDQIRLSLYGAGNYATATLLPSLVKASKEVGGVVFDRIATSTGRSAWQVGERFGFRKCVGTLDEILEGDCDAVMIATRHGNHAAAVVSSLTAGKHVYVEKPLALTLDECHSIGSALERNPDRQLLIGFNRRFSPLVDRLREHFAGITQPLVVCVRVNAGRIPRDSWIHDPEQGGGRLIGEGCHFIDLIAALGDSPVVAVSTRAAGAYDRSALDNDNVVVTVGLRNGTLGVVTYVSVGPRGVAKEYVEVFGGGRGAVLDDFRQLRLYADERRTATVRLPRQDKGQTNMLKAWLSGLKTGASPVSREVQLLSSIAVIRAVESLTIGAPCTVSLVPSAANGGR